MIARTHQAKQCGVSPAEATFPELLGEKLVPVTFSLPEFKIRGQMPASNYQDYAQKGSKYVYKSTLFLTSRKTWR